MSFDNGENIDADLTDRQRWDIAELSCVIENIDREQMALDQLQRDDPVGLVWFGERDDWVDSRLSRKDPK